METYRTLPKGGAIEDQPAGLLRKCRVAKNTYDAFMSRKQTSQRWPDWVRSHPTEANIINAVLEMRRGR